MGRTISASLMKPGDKELSNAPVRFFNPGSRNSRTITTPATDGVQPTTQPPQESQEPTPQPPAE